MASTRTGARRAQLVLHLHGLDRQQPITGLDLLTGRDPDLGDAPGYLRVEAGQTGRSVLPGRPGSLLAKLRMAGVLDSHLETPAVDDDLETLDGAAGRVGQPLHPAVIR